MSRSLALLSAMGGMAIGGLSIAPFLHRPEMPNRWFELSWPRDVDTEHVEQLLRHLAASRRPDVIAFETFVERGTVTHFVGVVQADQQRLLHDVAAFLPDVLVTPAEHPPTPLRSASELRLSSRERALRSDASIEITSSLLIALHGVPGSFVVQWLLGPRLQPSQVPAESTGLPSNTQLLKRSLVTGHTPLDAKARTALQTKVGDHGFRSRLLIGSSIKPDAVAIGALRRVIGGLRVAEAPGVHWRVRRTSPERLRRVPRRFGLALNAAELTGLLGWPLGDVEYTGIARQRSRRLAVPPALPSKGRVIGEGNHPRTRRPVAQSAADSLMHTHVLGPTGTGKSTLLANLALQDIASGRGVVIVEPKGDLVNDILARIPRSRLDDVVILDPTAVERPVGLNPLHGAAPGLVADQLLSVLRGLYGDQLGPRTTDVLHAALLTLAGSDKATMVALPLLLSDASVRSQLTPAVEGDLALGPFWRWFDSLSDAERSSVVAPSLNKVRRFLHEPLRTIVGQLQPKFDLSSVFKRRTILLVPLPKGIIGGETAALLGSLVVARLWQATQARAALPPEQRHPVTVIIDEFQDFLHLPTDLGDVLAQARSLGVGVTLAHQHLQQLTPDVRAAVLANARSRICFRLGADDAAVIARTSEEVDALDLQSLGAFETYAALVHDALVQPFASVTTTPLSKPTTDVSELRTRSAARFGRDRAEVEAELEAIAKPGGKRVGSRQRRAP